MHIWPGSPVPAGSHVRRRRHQLRALLRGRGADRAVPVRRRRRRRRGSTCPSATGSSGTATCRASGRGSGTATACTGPYDPAAGLRCNPAKLLLDPYAKAIDGHIDWNEALFSYRFGDPDSRNDADSAPYAMTSVVINPYFDWAGDRPLRIPYNETVIYEAHVKGMTMRHPGIPEDVRGSYAGPRAPGDDRALPQARGHRRRADAGAPVRARLDARRAGACRTTGATTPSASSPRTTTTPRFGTRGEQVLEFKTMVRSLHRAGIEVILDVVYNHTAEGNHLGPTLSFRGIDNQAYYRLVAGRPAALLRHHRHRQQPQRPPPRVAAADHGLAAVLGHRDARRRVPVRPRLRAGPGVPRGRPARGVLRPGQPGPGRQPGQAHRRAVGRRRGRLPGRRVPPAVDGVERPLPRHRARLLARRAGEPRRVRVAVHRLARTCTRPTAGGPSRRSTS